MKVIINFTMFALLVALLSIANRANASTKFQEDEASQEKYWVTDDETVEPQDSKYETIEDEGNPEQENQEQNGDNQNGDEFENYEENY